MLQEWSSAKDHCTVMTQCHTCSEAWYLVRPVSESDRDSGPGGGGGGGGDDRLHVASGVGTV